MFKKALLAAGAAMLIALPAHGATVTKTISFDTTNFVDTQGLTTTFPYNSVSGSFTVTFDPTKSYNNDTTDIKVNSFSGPPVSSPFGFTYFASGSGAGFFFFGGTQSNSDYVAIGTADYILSLNLSNLSKPTAITCADTGIVCGHDTGKVGVLASGYTVTGSNSLFFELASATKINGGTPEPASWALMILGFGFIGAALRSRRAVPGVA
jgi:hypothetical protein